MNKYHAKKTEYNGRTFDSKKEANRAWELDMLKKAGEVVEVEYQPVFECVIDGKKICKYIADFQVTYKDGHVEYEDIKGCKKGCAYQLFRLKKKMVEALSGVEILEL